MAGASGGVRRRGLLLAVVLVVGAIAVVALRQGTGSASRVPEDPAEQMVLRLHDLPLGYYPLDFSEGAGSEFTCEPIQPAKPKLPLTKFIKRFGPEGCMGLYLRAYRVPGTGASAAVIGTGTLDAGSVEAGEAGFAVAPEMLAALAEKNGAPEEVTPGASVGDATSLFHWKHAPTYRGSRLGSFFVWRSGGVLAAVFASAGSLEASDRIVVALAQRQQTHIEHPTPYTRAERNATEVGLDDPALKLPVYWLGRNFDPGHGLPVARLESGEAPPRPYALPRQKLNLRYSKNVYLNSWTSRGWKRFLQTPGSRIMRTWRCTESIELEIPGGHARVFAAQGRDFDVCPDRPPSLFFAFTYLHGTVIAVNFVSCPHCEQVPYGPYNSLRGMKAVVRGLAPRPQRTSWSTTP